MCRTLYMNRQRSITMPKHGYRSPLASMQRYCQKARNQRVHGWRYRDKVRNAYLGGGLAETLSAGDLGDKGLGYSFPP